MTLPAERISLATVISGTRRYVELRDRAGKICSAIVESKAMDIVTGDEVEYISVDANNVVKRVLTRKNCLSRCYRKTEKKIAANLDLVIIVTAVDPLFNTTFVDRLIVASSEQEIEFMMVLNKVDLGIENTKELINLYSGLKIPFILTSVLNDQGLDELVSYLQRPGIEKIALAGISGVGKSSILNKLIPGAERETNIVSKRTGQGKQTTSQAYAYPFQKTDRQEILLIDLPGLSSFGLTHLSKESIRFYFKDFLEFQGDCQYADCLHIMEPSCAVKNALAVGKIAASRYKSYTEILKEIEDAREY